MTGFGIDDQGDWFAHLGCGHRQHVRHRPPFINRPWVTTKAGRDGRIGRTLDCVRCDRLELPDALVWLRDSNEFTESSVPAALRASHGGGDVWIRILVTRGTLRFRIAALDVTMPLTCGQPGVVPPHTEHCIEPCGPAAFFLQAFQVRQPQPSYEDGQA